MQILVKLTLTKFNVKLEYLLLNHSKSFFMS